MVTQAQMRANTKYVAKTYRRFELKLRKVEDVELIEYLESKASISDYLKQLVKNDYLRSK